MANLYSRALAGMLALLVHLCVLPLLFVDGRYGIVGSDDRRILHLIFVGTTDFRDGKTVQSSAQDKALDFKSLLDRKLEQVPSLQINPGSKFSLLIAWQDEELSASTEVLKWREQVYKSIREAWTQADNSIVDSNCQIALIQDPGGAVIGVRTLKCSADDITRDSLLTAIYRVSPLPPYPGKKPLDGIEMDFAIRRSD